jgi:hypothetical protein
MDKKGCGSKSSWLKLMYFSDTPWKGEADVKAMHKSLCRAEKWTEV